MGCMQFLFAGHLLAIPELGVSWRVTACVWLRGGFWFGVGSMVVADRSLPPLRQ